MKTLLISAVASESTESGANRLRKLAKGLSQNGMQVAWGYPGSELTSKKYWEEIHSKSFSGKFGKLFNIWALNRAAKNWGEQHEGPIVVSMPATWLILLAWLLCRQFGGRVWLDYRDPILNQSINKRSSWFIRCVRFFEQRSLAACGGVIVAAPRIEAFLSPKPPKTICVYGGIDPDEVSRAEGRTSGFRVLYGGTFYSGRSPTELIRALGILAKAKKIPSDFRLDLYAKFNDAAEGESFLDLIEKEGVREYVKFAPLVSRSEFLKEMEKCNQVLIITHSSGSDYAIPGKIFDYLTMQKPILAISEDAALREFAKKFSLPIFFTPVHDPAAIAKALESFFRLGIEKTNMDISALFLQKQAKAFLENL